MHKTTVMIDDERIERASKILGTTGIRDTVEAALDEVIARDARMRFLERIASATTLGDLYSEVLYPAISSHRRIPVEERRRLRITDGFVRLSVGIEDPADLTADIDRALERA